MNQLELAEATFEECGAQMSAGVCMTLQPVVGDLVVAGVGKLPATAWNHYVSLVNPEAPTSDLSMCRLARDKIISEPGGIYQQTAQILWPVHRVEKPAPVADAAVALSVLAAGAVAAVASRLRKPQVA